ncbi:hypothetical protein NDU88_004612 [Pleurodeles waltl]|uniref:Solute carrier family 22 member 23 n=1 Tax=Pleurodeles waltl TaxID=8319 RepID=A0AAV7VJA0_PLEWA|nr:hypothetical protein NDU88_004612 [Pleurodeles waltl]
MATERRGAEPPRLEENGSALPASPGPGSRRGSAGEAPSPLLLDFDGSVMPVAGALGPYSRRLVLLTWIPMLFIGFSQFSDSFLLDQPDYWCLGSRGNDTGHRLLGPTGGPGLPPSHNLSQQSRALGERPAPAGDPHLGADCGCHQWQYQIRAGLVQNVVSKVRGAAELCDPDPSCTSSCAPSFPPMVLLSQGR